MSDEHIHRNDKGHVLAKKSTPVEYINSDDPRGAVVAQRLTSAPGFPPVRPPQPEPEIQIANPHGDFRVVKPGENKPHDIGCLCTSCVARRREQAKDPHFQAIVEARAAKLPPEQAEALRRAVYGDKTPWWKRLLRR